MRNNFFRSLVRSILFPGKVFSPEPFPGDFASRRENSFKTLNTCCFNFERNDCLLRFFFSKLSIDSKISAFIVMIYEFGADNQQMLPVIAKIDSVSHIQTKWR